MPAKKEAKSDSVEVELRVEKPTKVHNVFIGATQIEFNDGKATVSSEQAELLKQLEIVK